MDEANAEKQEQEEQLKTDAEVPGGAGYRPGRANLSRVTAWRKGSSGGMEPRG